MPAMVANGRVALAIREVFIFTPGETPARVLDRFRPFADRALRAFLETLASVKSGRRTPPRGPSRG